MVTPVKNVYARRANHSAIFLATILMALLMAFSVFAWRHSTNTIKVTSIPKTHSQAQIPVRTALSNSATDRFPLAGRFRARLGKRFLSQGKITTELIGLLQRGRDQEPLRLTRSYSERGETVTFTVGGKSTLFQWQDSNGAKTDGAQANTDNRKLIERLALDSPDQFVLAQLRATAYQIIAEGVRPEESTTNSSRETYTGPLWTIIQVLEASGVTEGRPLSTMRHYYLNQQTGLLDRTLSQEEGKTISAEFSGWSARDGEAFPALIVWKSGGEELMRLTVNNISFSVRQ